MKYTLDNNNEESVFKRTKKDMGLGTVTDLDYQEFYKVEENAQANLLGKELKLALNKDNSSLMQKELKTEDFKMNNWQNLNQEVKSIEFDQ